MDYINLSYKESLFFRKRDFISINVKILKSIMNDILVIGQLYFFFLFYFFLHILFGPS